MQTIEDVLATIARLKAEVRRREDAKNRHVDRQVYLKSRGRAGARSRDSLNSELGREARARLWDVMDARLNKPWR